MSREVLSLKQAAEHVHLELNELRHIAQRGEIEALLRGEDWYFEHRALDEWAQRELLVASHREQLRRHSLIVAEERRARQQDLRIAELFKTGSLSLSMSGKTKAGAIREMADLAARTGLVYDAEGLYRELKEREDIASTAVGEGAAFLHPRFHDPYLFEESFIAYARASYPVFFGAPEGEPTRHFFLICSTDHEQHLKILSRLAVMAHATEFLSILDEAESVETVQGIIRSAEEALIGL